MNEKTLVGHVQEVLKIKDERDEHTDKQIEHYQKYKHHLGRVQELSRQLNDKIGDLEEYRLTSEMYKVGAKKKSVKNGGK